MTFADAGRCLSCHGAITGGVSVCPHCGINLASAEIQEAWRSLVAADQLIERARVAQHAKPPPVAPAVAPPEVAKPRARLSAGTVLLVIGAVSLLVAGLIFTTVSWGSMGIVGRALSLLGFTSVVGGLASAMTRRVLRASAEALWTVFLGLLTLDWFAARDQNLFGLHTVPAGYAAGAWGLMVLGVGIAIARTGRRPVGAALVAPAVAAAVAPIVGAAGVAAEVIDGEPFWWAFSTGIVAGLVTVLHGRLGFIAARRVAAVGAALLAASAVVAAVIEAMDHPALGELAGGGHGVPLLVVAGGAVGVGVLARPTVRSTSASVAALAVTTLMVLPADAAWSLRGGYVVGSVVVVALAAAGVSLWLAAWTRGLRWASGVTAVLLGIAAAPWLARLADVAAHGAVGHRTQRLSEQIQVGHGGYGPWWVALVVGAGIGAGMLFARRWPELARVRHHLGCAGAVVLALGAAAAVAAPVPPAVLLGGSLAVIGVSLGWLTRGGPLGWRHVGPAWVAVTPGVTLSSWPASIIVWPLCAVALTLLAWRSSDRTVRWGGGGVASWWACLAPGVVMEFLDHSDEATGLAIIVASVATLAVGALVFRKDAAFIPPDAGALAAGFIGLAVATTDGGHALPWTVAGAGVTVVGLLNRRRAWCRFVGPVLLGVAYVVRLADAGVDIVEAYTAPFAMALLAAGWWAMRRHENRIGSLQALGPGVTLALLPSLPQAVDEPTSLRALLLGLVAVAMLVVGSLRRWRAPFLGGGAVTLALVLANIGPWALGLPRWVLIATLGAAAIGVGATWESRVRNGRAAASYVTSMR